MEKLIIEVGSTNTKLDLYDGVEVVHIGSETIEFKRNYKKENKLNDKDVKTLINLVNKYKEKYRNVYVCGTSIFRNLDIAQKQEFLNTFNKETGVEFEIISSERENELTVYGKTKNENRKVAIFIGGGGSTEIAIYENGIKEMINTQFGVMDIMNMFPDLGDDLAKTKLETVQKVVKDNLNLPKEKADILILAGGGHEKFARYSGIKYEENTLYEDDASPIMMDIETRKSETERYYKSISLDEIREKVNDPDWWYATRAMSAFALVVAEEIGAKYIVPTDIAMVYGILEEEK